MASDYSEKKILFPLFTSIDFCFSCHENKDLQLEKPFLYINEQGKTEIHPLSNLHGYLKGNTPHINVITGRDGDKLSYCCKCAICSVGYTSLPDGKWEKPSYKIETNAERSIDEWNEKSIKEVKRLAQLVLTSTKK